MYVRYFAPSDRNRNSLIQPETRIFLNFVMPNYKVYGFTQIHVALLICTLNFHFCYCFLFTFIYFVRIISIYGLLLFDIILLLSALHSISSAWLNE